MKPVFQKPMDGQCQRAAVASIFELPIEEVPWFGQRAMEAEDRGEPVKRYEDTQHAELEAWLKERGLGMVYIYVDPDRARPGQYIPRGPHGPWGLCIASGDGGRGFSHAVVWDADAYSEATPYGRMVHDPHPSQAGLLTITRWTCFSVIDPARFGAWAVRAARERAERDALRAWADHHLQPDPRALPPGGPR